MRKWWMLTGFLFVMFQGFSQSRFDNNYIKDMKWSTDYNIHLRLFNDSSYTINVKNMIHSSISKANADSSTFTYYPVMLDRTFVDKFRQTNRSDTSVSAVMNQYYAHPATLWSALHSSIGGGWVHFINCMMYALETHYLSITAPLLKRPESSWKPDPLTETYKRTQKWHYYVPVNQRWAHKEYYIKKKNNQLDNLQDVPADFIHLFLTTNNRKYRKMQASKDNVRLARIDLVKLLLGANYLGTVQINYIKTMVQKAVVKYSFNQLPNIIVFDDLGAAVVMSLNETGYKLERIVFREGQHLTPEDRELRKQKIEMAIRTINRANQKIFEERLKNYYQH